MQTLEEFGWKAITCLPGCEQDDEICVLQDTGSSLSLSVLPTAQIELMQE